MMIRIIMHKYAFVKSYLNIFVNLYILSHPHIYPLFSLCIFTIKPFFSTYRSHIYPSHMHSKTKYTFLNVYYTSKTPGDKYRLRSLLTFTWIFHSPLSSDFIHQFQHIYCILVRHFRAFQGTGFNRIETALHLIFITGDLFRT